MCKYISIVLIATIVLVSGTGYWMYSNYDESAQEGWSKTLRQEMYSYRNRNEERLVLAPDLPSVDPETFDATEVDQRAGLKRKDYHFTADWFSRKSPAWEVALKDFAGRSDIQYLEVGVYEGRSVIWMLENILTHPTSHVTGIDIFYKLNTSTYSAAQQEIYEDNVVLAGGESRSTTIVEFSQTALRKLPLNHYDIIYIDGSHLASSVLEDAILSFRLLKEGGVIIFDDYRWFTTAPRLESPRYAIDTFIEFFGDQFEVLHTESQVILKRTKLDDKSIGLDLDVAEGSE